MNIIDVERLERMLQDTEDLKALKKLMLTDIEIEGYLIFFADNTIKPFSTIFERPLDEKYS